MSFDINTQEIQPFYEDYSMQEAFTWEGRDPVFEQEQEKNLPFRVLIPIVMEKPDIICWDQTGGEFIADEAVLYTIRFKDQSGSNQENASVSSMDSELLLPSIPVKVYAWVQGYPVEFMGEAEICRISPVNPRTSFLIDGNDAEEINHPSGSFRFVLPENLTDYRFEPSNRTNFTFKYVGDSSNPGSKTVFVSPNPQNLDYNPYFQFSTNAFGQGFKKVRVLTDRQLQIDFYNMNPEIEGFLYIDGRRVEIPEDPELP